MVVNVTIKIEDGKVVNSKGILDNDVEDVTVSTLSKYARCFDESCPSWNKDSKVNLMFLKLQQQYANDLLKTRGCVFLNEIYDMLGMPRSRSGAIVGWVYDANNPKGDNHIDFGIHTINQNQHFINGKTNIVWLDFNVDGNILEHLSE